MAANKKSGVKYDPSRKPPRMEIRAENIPAKLKALNQWVLWDWEWKVNKQGEGKWTKPPKHVAGRNASSTDPATWTTFDEALKASERHDGIGIVVTEDNRIVGHDYDDCVGDNGVLSPDALELVDQLDSYTEYSPSGTGIRVFSCGTLPPIGRKKGAIEMYETGRYLTVTGHRVPGTLPEVRDRQGAIDAVHALVFGKRDATNHGTEQRTSAADADDDALIERAKAARNGSKFTDLWSGNWESRYPSQSEATGSLCLMLAYWTAGDTARMDRLFRRSGLMRDKWDETRGNSTWGQQQIEAAISTCGSSAQSLSSASAKEGQRIEVVKTHRNDESELFDGPPLPFADGSYSAAFPVDALPFPLAETVRNIAHDIKVNVGATGGLIPGVVAACAGNAFRVRVTPAYTERTLARFALWAEFSGGRKSAVMTALTGPLTEWEANELERIAPERKRLANEADVLRQRIHHLKGRAAKETKETERRILVEEINELSDGIVEPPPTPKVYTNDTTSEKFIRTMAEQGGSLAIISGELRKFANIIQGRYQANGGNDDEVLLSAHAGDPIRYERVGKEREISIFIENPSASVVGGLQPDACRSLATSESLRGSGTVARFHFFEPPSMIGFREEKEREIALGMPDEYPLVLHRVLDLRRAINHDTKTPVILTFTPDAAELRRRFFNQLEATLRPDADDNQREFSDIISKATGEGVRLAGGFALVRVASKMDLRLDHLPDIIPEDWERAEAVSAWHLDETLRFINTSREGSDVLSAKAVLEWISRKPRERERFTKRDLQQSGFAALKTETDREAALSVLVKHDWIARVSEKGKPAPRYVVNPLGLKEIMEAADE